MSIEHELLFAGGVAADSDRRPTEGSDDGQACARRAPMNLLTRGESVGKAAVHQFAGKASEDEIERRFKYVLPDKMAQAALERQPSFGRDRAFLERCDGTAPAGESGRQARGPVA
ncbi:MAG: hypothetical protein WD468_03440 [Pirellulales bacterium]